MNKLKQIKTKISNFVLLHKIPIIIGLVVFIVIGGVAFFYGTSELLNEVKMKDYVSSNPKSVDDFTKSEKEVLGITEESTKLQENLEKGFSDEYKKYESLTDEEKEELEVIPRKEEIPFSEIDDIKEDLDIQEEKIPTSYNLKDVINIKVENQESLGLCWDFASMKSLETNILLHEGRDLDLSELHLDYYQSSLMYGYRELHNGGNFSDFEEYSLLTDAVLEDDLPYGNYSTHTILGHDFKYFEPVDYTESQYSKFTNINGVTRATEIVNFPSVRKTNGNAENITEEELNEFRNAVKSHIMKNGSLYTVIESPNDTNSYCDKDCVGNNPNP